jgi:hypothetical protein
MEVSIKATADRRTREVGNFAPALLGNFDPAFTPVSRFLSAYSNRVIFHRELSEAQIPNEFRDYGAIANPDLEYFVEHLDVYRGLSWSIMHHTEPQVVFLGRNPAFYDRLFKFNELGALLDELKQRTGLALELPHEQRGGPKLNRNDLPQRVIRKIIDRYEDDYALYGSF